MNSKIHLGKSLTNQLEGRKGDRFDDEVNNELEERLNIQLWGHINYSTYVQLFGSLWDNLHNRVDIEIKNELKN